jgi:hypothetical protein
MKIVVYGPQKRTGVLREGSVVDLSGAFAKYAAEKDNEPHPTELAEAVVPSDLARLIEAGHAIRRIRGAQRWSSRPPPSTCMRRIPRAAASPAPAAISPTTPRRWPKRC